MINPDDWLVISHYRFEPSKGWLNERMNERINGWKNERINERMWERANQTTSRLKNRSEHPIDGLTCKWRPPAVTGRLHVGARCQIQTTAGRPLKKRRPLLLLLLLLKRAAWKNKSVRDPKLKEYHVSRDISRFGCKIVKVLANVEL